MFHLNGAVEDLPESDGIRRRSPFLLESDAATHRTSSLEFNQAIQFIAWGSTFVVVGMSFACPTDWALLSLLHSVEDDLPVGGGWWLVVNRDCEDANKVAAHIQAALPRALVTYVASSFEEWIVDGLPQLAVARILEPRP